jgi:hypothetical protein
VHHAETELLDWYPVDNHLPGVDLFPTPGKHLLHLCPVGGGVDGGDPVADQREIQALTVIDGPPACGRREPPAFFMLFLSQWATIPSRRWILLPALLFIDPARIFFAGAGSINKIIMIIGLLRRQGDLCNG